jgi:hypothetical protein
LVVLAGVGVGVAVCVGFGVGLDVDFVGLGVGVRVLPRLGAVVDRVGVGLFVADRIGVGVAGVGVVRRGVYDGLVGRTGVLSSTDVIGLSWLVTLLVPV